MKIKIIIRLSVILLISNLSCYQAIANSKTSDLDFVVTYESNSEQFKLRFSNENELFAYLDTSNNSIFYIEVTGNATCINSKIFNKLNSLTSLYLKLPRLDKMPMEIFDIETIEFLHLDSLPISEIPPQISRLSDLSTLIITNSVIQVVDLNLLQKNKLKTLDLSNNKIDSVIIGNNEFSSLYSLNLKYNKLSNFNFVYAMPNLRKLNLAFNDFTKIDIDLNKVPLLINVYLNNNEINEFNIKCTSYEGPNIFLGVNNIRTLSSSTIKCDTILYLRGNPLSDKTKKEILNSGRNHTYNK